MEPRSSSHLSNKPSFEFFLTIIALLFFNFPYASLLSFAQPQGGSWDFSLGGVEKLNKPSYSVPLRKLEREVYSYPYSPQEETSTPESPLGKDYYTYILPQEIFGIRELGIEFPERTGSEIYVEKIKAEEIARELEEALPIVMKSALEKKAKGEEGGRYLVRLKMRKETGEEESEAEGQKVEEKQRLEGKITEENPPSEEEIDLLVSIIFGQNKILIKIPPLKDPKEKERLIKELERIAEILVRQEELLRIQQVSE